MDEQVKTRVWRLVEESLGWLGMLALVGVGVGGTLAYQWLAATGWWWAR